MQQISTDLSGLVDNARSVRLGVRADAQRKLIDSGAEEADTHPIEVGPNGTFRI